MCFCAQNVEISTTWCLLFSSGNIVGLNIFFSAKKTHSFHDKSCLLNICRSKASRMPSGIRNRGLTSWEKMWISVLLLASSSRWIQAMLAGPNFLRTSRLCSGTSLILVLPLWSKQYSTEVCHLCPHPQTVCNGGPRLWADMRNNAGGRGLHECPGPCKEVHHSLHSV